MEEPISEGMVRETGQTGTGIMGRIRPSAGASAPTSDGASVPTEWSQQPSGPSDQQGDGPATARASAMANRMGSRPAGEDLSSSRPVFGPIGTPPSEVICRSGEGHGPSRTDGEPTRRADRIAVLSPPVRSEVARVSSGKGFGPDSRRLPGESLSGEPARPTVSQANDTAESGGVSAPKRSDGSADVLTAICMAAGRARPHGEGARPAARIPERVEASAETPSGFPFASATTINRFDEGDDVIVIATGQQPTESSVRSQERPQIKLLVAGDAQVGPKGCL